MRKVTSAYPLRRRLIEDVMVRDLSPATQSSYVHAVGSLPFRGWGEAPKPQTQRPTTLRYRSNHLPRQRVSSITGRFASEYAHWSIACSVSIVPLWPGLSPCGPRLCLLHRYRHAILRRLVRDAMTAGFAPFSCNLTCLPARTLLPLHQRLICNVDPTCLLGDAARAIYTRLHVNSFMRAAPSPPRRLNLLPGQ